MAQAEEKNTINQSDILFQLHAPEVSMPQVLVKEAAVEKGESQLIKKKLRKLFSKGKSNAKITEEFKNIKGVKTNLDMKVIAYRNNQFRF